MRGNRTRTLWAIAALVSAVFVSACESGSKSKPDAGVVCTEEDPFDLEQCPESYPEYDCVTFVDGDVEKSGDGWSWATAVKTVQEGIDLAHCGAEIHGVCSQWEVWVKQGTYYVHQGCREHAVRLRSDVAVYGGFNGTETFVDKREWVKNVTILDGRDGPEGSRRVYHVVLGSDRALLDGFTVTGGNADGGELQKKGGGMLNWGVSPSVHNCTFRENRAEQFGGGMANLDASPLVKNSVFQNNEAFSMGFSYSGAIDSEGGSPEFEGCTFAENRSVGLGGAVSNYENQATYVDCMFDSNQSGKRGAAVENLDADVEFIDCHFVGNVEMWSAEGGAGIGSGESDIAISGCTFEDNLAAGWGGAILAWASTILVSESQFTGNSGKAGGAVAVDGESAVEIVGCTFASNHAQLQGGAVLGANSSSLDVENCVFIGNTAGVGGGIAGLNSSLVLTNSTLTGNVAAGGAGGLAFENSVSDDSGAAVVNSVFWENSPYEIGYLPLSATLEVTYCDIQGGFDGDGNIDADPLFADEDLRLGAGSPCIDAANGDLAPELDYDGNPRIDDPGVDPNSGTGNPDYADIGAYEYQP